MANFEPKEKYTGEFNGRTISFNRVWSGHRFTDAECEALLQGNDIIIEAISKTGSKYSVVGKLGEGNYEGKSFISFQPDFERKIVPISFLGHVFSNKERANLEDRKSIYCTDLVSKKGNTFSANLTFDEEKGLEMHFENT